MVCPFRWSGLEDNLDMPFEGDLADFAEDLRPLHCPLMEMDYTEFFPDIEGPQQKAEHEFDFQVRCAYNGQCMHNGC